MRSLKLVTILVVLMVGLIVGAFGYKFTHNVESNNVLKDVAAHGSTLDGYSVAEPTEVRFENPRSRAFDESTFFIIGVEPYQNGKQTGFLPTSVSYIDIESKIVYLIPQTDAPFNAFVVQNGKQISVSRQDPILAGIESVLMKFETHTDHP